MEPLYGYLLLGMKLQFIPNKYSGAWNFGTEKNTVTSVKQIAEMALETWGKGKLNIKNTNKFYEQAKFAIKYLKIWKKKF